MVKLLEKSRFWSKMSKILDLGQNLPKCPIWSNLTKMSLIVIIFLKCRFGSIFSNITIFSKNLNLGKTFRKFSFWWKLSQKLKFGHNFRKISNLVKIEQNVDFSQIFKLLQKTRVGSNFSKILISVEIIVKSQIWSKFSKNLDFGENCRKFSILVKILENVDVKIFGKCRLGSKLTKLSFLDKTEENCWF